MPCIYPFKIKKLLFFLRNDGQSILQIAKICKKKIAFFLQFEISTDQCAKILQFAIFNFSILTDHHFGEKYDAF